ncbi:MAG: TRAM domain-containing protein, partial [Staphylococcus epidermidis]|nr:TRAM domain-containing protein [Staphylococcus epidermidis]
VLAGYTDKNKLVNFKGPRESIGKLVDVKIDEAKQYSLNGTFIQEHQRSMVTQ